MARGLSNVEIAEQLVVSGTSVASSGAVPSSEEARRAPISYMPSGQCETVMVTTVSSKCEHRGAPGTLLAVDRECRAEAARGQVEREGEKWRPKTQPVP
jgi:hypothetical protein